MEGFHALLVRAAIVPKPNRKKLATIAIKPPGLAFARSKAGCAGATTRHMAAARGTCRDPHSPARHLAIAHTARTSIARAATNRTEFGSIHVQTAESQIHSSVAITRSWVAPFSSGRSHHRLWINRKAA